MCGEGQEGLEAQCHEPSQQQQVGPGWVFCECGSKGPQQGQVAWLGGMWVWFQGG